MICKKFVLDIGMPRCRLKRWARVNDNYLRINRQVVAMGDQHRWCRRSSRRVGAERDKRAGAAWIAVPVALVVITVAGGLWLRPDNSAAVTAT